MFSIVPVGVAVVPCLWLLPLVFVSVVVVVAVVVFAGSSQLPRKSYALSFRTHRLA